MSDAALSHSTAEGSKPGTTILKLSGPLTLSNMFAFQNQFRALRPPVLIVDMSEVNYMDSAGLGLLVNSHVAAEGDGRKFLLVGLTDRLTALMEMTRVDRVLKSFPSIEAAEASVP